MNVHVFLNELADKGVEVWEDAGRIHYSAEKGSMNEKTIELLKENKQAILSVLAAEEDDKILKPDFENINDPFPLTDLQSAYFIGRSGAYDYGNSACQIYLEFEFSKMDVKRLEAALNRLIRRHDMLRAIVLVNGTQKILENVPEYHIEIVNTGKAENAKDNLKKKSIRESMFDQILKSDEWPLFQIKASLFEDGKGMLHAVIDQLISDAYSVQIFFDELFRLYNDPDLALTPLEVSFRDYVVRENTLTDSAEYKKAEQYWNERISTIPPAPELPLKYNVERRNNLASFTRRSSKLGKEKWRRLEKVALERGVTPSIVLLTAYAEVLSHWSARRDFTLNLTIFNRKDVHPQIMDIIGDFSSTSLLEINPSDSDFFKEKALKLHRQLWDDMDNLLFSGVKVIRELSKERDSASNEMMPIVFTSTIGNRNLTDASKGNEQIKLTYSITKTPQVWLDNQVYEDNGELYISWDALEEIFPEGVLDAMFNAYLFLIEQLVDNQASWEEKNPLKLYIDNHYKKNKAVIPERESSRETLYALFEKQCRQRTNEPAVIASSKKISYDELYELSKNIGFVLRKNGAAKNQLVGIVMEKGWEQIAAVLGVLKAGAAYLPISADFPDDRIKYLLKNGEVSLVLTQSWLDDKIDWPKDVKRFSLDQALENISEYQEFDVSYDINDIAYVIYTSGSTGLPKGVLIDHKGAVNTILDINERFKIDSSDRVFGVSNLNFDLSVYDIFGALAAGGTIVLPDSKLVKDPKHWSELIAQQGVTVWNSVPALMQMLVEYNNGRSDFNLSSLRLALLSGDWIPLDLPEAINRVSENIDVISLGGATEASIWSVLYPVKRIDPAWKSIPYGYSMDNQELYILNERMETCPHWVAGDIYIGGIGVGRGYWKDDEKTALSFVYHDEFGERLYKTGDKGRFLSDGTIEFLGREDQQIKINGFRIELGEINSVFSGESGIESAATVALEDGNGSKQLVSYLVPDNFISSQLFDSKSVEDKSIEKIIGLVQEGSKSFFEKLTENITEAQYTKFQDYSDEMTLNVIARSVLNLGLFKTEGVFYNFESLCKESEIAGKFQSLFQKWLSLLEMKDCLISNSKKEYCALPKFYKISEMKNEPGDFFNDKDGSDKMMELKKRLKFIEMELPSILTGKNDILNQLLEEESSMGAGALSSLNDAEIYFQEFISFLVAEICSGIDNESGKKIMEVGTRSKNLIKTILGRVPENVSYLYTDESQYFLDKSLKENSEYSNFSTRIFDLNKDVSEQIFNPGQFDLILAYNALHRSKNIDKTLKNLKKLLNAGGALIFFEATKNRNIEFISTGLFEAGSQAYSDFRKENHRPLISEENWQETLINNGFKSICEFPKAQDRNYFDLKIFVAFGPLAIKVIDEEKCRKFAELKLPEYMVPQYYRQIDKLPLTVNGKIDLKELMDNKFFLGEKLEQEEVKLPETLTEKSLKNIWEKVLNVEISNIDLNFFDLGGDSLLATQMVNSIREEYEIELSLQIILQEGTIYLIARQIDEILFENENCEEGAI